MSPEQSAKHAYPRAAVKASRPPEGAEAAVAYRVVSNAAPGDADDELGPTPGAAWADAPVHVKETRAESRAQGAHCPWERLDAF